MLTATLLAVWLVVGDTSWTSLLTLTTFWWSLPAVALVLVALLRGDRRAALLLALPALLWVWSYGTAFTGRAEGGGSDLRVVSFNTYVHTAGEQHVLDLVEATEPDVLVLQEVFPPREESLRSVLADRFPHVHVDQSPGVGGVAVWSRHPITDVVEVADASEVSRSTSVVNLEVDGVRLQVVPVHLISPCPVCGTSILERLELEDDVRRAEIGAVLDTLDPEAPAIVAGDLNSNDRAVAYRTLTGAGFRDPQREAGSGMGFTWPADGPLPAFLRIDWVLVRGLEPVDAWVDDARGSDHRPVVVDVTWPATTGRS